jgi:hypothetical protein
MCKSRVTPSLHEGDISGRSFEEEKTDEIS